jgi:DNA-directed RNA polymerase subunit K/omega
MDDTNELNDQDPAPLVPAEPAPPIESRFLFVDVAALRAKQLRRGARVRYETEPGAAVMKKPERMAMEEVRRGLVPYQVPPPRPAGAEGQGQP